tara:strand:+ start:335 stop:736 length:402 start_codon:yes stop_codon:yes gene_type:complete
MAGRFVGFGKKLFDLSKKQGEKSSTVSTIVGVAPKVNKSKKEKALSKLNILKQKTKTSALKLKNTLADIKEKATKRENKMGGGMMGRRMGYSQGSSKGKVPTTPKEKSLAKLAPPKDKITFGDVVAGRTKGKA